MLRQSGHPHYVGGYFSPASHAAPTAEQQLTVEIISDIKSSEDNSEKFIQLALELI
jgi:hypothetical protein